MLHVISAKYLKGYSFYLELDDGSQGVVDLEASLTGPVFAPLKRVELFKEGRLDPELETLAWPNGADFAPEYLRDLLRDPG